jgi:hypothetical protein
MWCVFRFACTDEFLIFRRKHVEHLLTRDKSCGCKGCIQLLPGTIPVQDRLATTFGHLHRHKGSDFWRVETIQCRINMPAIEAGVRVALLLRNHLTVGTAVMRMPQLDVLEAHERLDEAVTLYLDLGLIGDSHEVFMDRIISGFVMAVLFGRRIKTFGQLVLGFWGEIFLVFE